jgi:hypothetical protein
MELLHISVKIFKNPNIFDNFFAGFVVALSYENLENNKAT